MRQLRPLALAMFFLLSGCSGTVAVMVMEGLASAATVADKVVGIDVSLQQNQAGAGKTPIKAILTPTEPLSP